MLSKNTAMQSDSESVMELSIVMRQDGAIYLNAFYSAGIPQIAVPVVMRGLLATAIAELPGNANKFDFNEPVPHTKN